MTGFKSKKTAALDEDGMYLVHQTAQPAQEPWPEEPFGHMAGGVQPAQPAQEPVAWMYQCTADNSGPVLLRHRTNWAESNSGLWTETPLYTAPPQREWVDLTDDMIEDLFQSAAGADEETHIRFARAIEQSLKEKNT